MSFLFDLPCISHWWFSWRTHTHNCMEIRVHQPEVIPVPIEWLFLVIYDVEDAFCFLERKLQEAILENRWLPKRSLPFVISVGGVPWKTEIFFESLSVVSFDCPMMQPYLLISCMFVCWVQCSWRFCYQCQRCVVLVLFIPGKLLYTSLKLEFFWDNPQRLTNPFHRVIPGFESTGWY